MRKEVLCKSCQKPINVKSWAEDRAELAREIGTEFKITCKYCNKESSYEVNEVSAQPNSFFNFILFVGVLILMGLFGYYLFSNYWGKSFYMVFAIPLVIAVPGMIYFTYIKSQNNKIRAFNRYRR